MSALFLYLRYYTLFVPHMSTTWYISTVGVGKDRRIKSWSMMMTEKAAPVTGTTSYGHHICRVRINRVRLPILLVVSWAGKMNISVFQFAPENLVSRDGSAVPSRVSLLISILRLNLVLTYYGIPPEFRGGVHLFI